MSSFSTGSPGLWGSRRPGAKFSTSFAPWARADPALRWPLRVSRRRSRGKSASRTSDALAAYVLPPILMRLKERPPGIEIEVLASNEIRDLRWRVADIANRRARPDQPELIAKRVRRSSAHFDAATSYLDRYGRPQTAADPLDATFIGFAPLERLIAGRNSRGLALIRAQHHRRLHPCRQTGSAHWPALPSRPAHAHCAGDKMQ